MQPQPTTISGIAVPFTAHCQQLFVFASDAAAQLHHAQIGTEHLLLGLLHEDRIAELLGLRLDDAQQAVQALFAKSTQAAPAVLTTAPDAQHAIQAALAAAQQRHHPAVDTLHLLWGVLADDTNGAARVLTHAGISIERVRAAVEEILNRQDAKNAKYNED
jgi:ATP-dependent Clp protease ATP-binding subunit ClpC